MSDCNDTLRELELVPRRRADSEARNAIHVIISRAASDCLQTFDFHAELKPIIAQKCRTDVMPPGLLERIERCFERTATPIRRNPKAADRDRPAYEAR